jgi:hypothetical protein
MRTRRKMQELPTDLRAKSHAVPVQVSSARRPIVTWLRRIGLGVAAMAMVVVAVACGKVAAHEEGGGKGASGTCEPPSLRCGNGCANIATDAANCGVCGARCPQGDRCVDGACSSTGCPAGQTECGGLCVTLETNPLNCGACNQGCSPPEGCAGGACVCPKSARVCGGACTDIGISNEHCGACGHACAPDELCTGGVCGPRCTPPQTFCGGRCVNLANETTACGTCQTSCGPFEKCSEGRCECPNDSSHAICGNQCVDISTNGDNCGGCGKACDAGARCVDGACTSCTSGIFYCPSGTGDPLARCLSQATLAKAADGGGPAEPLPWAPDLACQCTHCLAELQDCAADAQCASAWQCAVAKACTSPCWDTMGVCSVGTGSVGACWKFCPPSTGSPQAVTRAEALMRCTNDNQCGM